MKQLITHSSDTKNDLVFTTRAGNLRGILMLAPDHMHLGYLFRMGQGKNYELLLWEYETSRVSFAYTANPIAILKGRIIAFLAFLAYTFLGQSSGIRRFFFFCSRSTGAICDCPLLELQAAKHGVPRGSL